MLSSLKFSHVHKYHKSKELPSLSTFKKNVHSGRAFVCRKHQTSLELNFNWLFSLTFWIKQFIYIFSLIELIQEHKEEHAFTFLYWKNFKL